ncbi:hypothetical protein BZA77DRAFT_391416 [Pyronema omphalodes]|nr:hypothetical protein BZA77DRAFT_391416 [Pyronema omphalodes]
MADPISFGASVLGLVGAAQKVGGLLYSFCSSMVNSVDSVTKLNHEIESITAVFRVLGAMVFQKEAQDIIRLPPSSFQPVLEALLTSVTGCVLIFSELEKLLDEVGNIKISYRKRIMWAIREGTVTDLQAHLERHKATLNLALSALNIAQSEQRHVQILRELRVLQAAAARKDDHSTRLSSIMSREDAIDISSFETSTIAKSISHSKTQFTGENASIRSFRSTMSVSTICKPVRHAFESVLRSTRVYKGKVWGSTDSLSSEATGRTKLTDLTTVSKMSNLSVFELLIVSDIYNAEHYLSIQTETIGKCSDSQSFRTLDSEANNCPPRLNLSRRYSFTLPEDHNTPSPPLREATSERPRPRGPRGPRVPLRNPEDSTFDDRPKAYPPAFNLSPCRSFPLQDNYDTPAPPSGAAFPEMFRTRNQLRSPEDSTFSGRDDPSPPLGEATSGTYRPLPPLRGLEDSKFSGRDDPSPPLGEATSEKRRLLYPPPYRQERTLGRIFTSWDDCNTPPLSGEATSGTHLLPHPQPNLQKLALGDTWNHYNTISPLWEKINSGRVTSGRARLVNPLEDPQDCTFGDIFASRDDHSTPSPPSGEVTSRRARSRWQEV